MPVPSSRSSLHRHCSLLELLTPPTPPVCQEVTEPSPTCSLCSSSWSPVSSFPLLLGSTVRGKKRKHTTFRDNRMLRIRDRTLQMSLRSPVVRSAWSEFRPSGAELALSVPRPVSLLTDVLLSRDTEGKRRSNEKYIKTKMCVFSSHSPGDWNRVYKCVFRALTLISWPMNVCFSYNS